MQWTTKRNTRNFLDWQRWFAWYPVCVNRSFNQRNIHGYVTTSTKQWVLGAYVWRRGSLLLREYRPYSKEKAE